MTNQHISVLQRSTLKESLRFSRKNLFSIDDLVVVDWMWERGLQQETWDSNEEYERTFSFLYENMTRILCMFLVESESSSPAVNG